MTETVKLRSTRLDDLLVQGLTHSADAVVLSGLGTELTGSEVISRARGLADELRNAGVRAGEPVLLPVDNNPQDVVCQLAAWLAGCVPIPVHRPFPASVAADVAARAAARVALGHVPSAWTEVVASTPGASVQRVLGGQDHIVPPVEINADQALVVFTSGSTGRPKGVVISHHAFATKLAAIDRVLDFRAGARMLQVLHLHFSFGQWTTLLTLASGGRVDLVQRFSAIEVLDRLAGTTYDRIAVVPTMMRMMATVLSAPSSGQLLDMHRQSGSPRLWIAGGEPLPAGLGRHFREMMPKSDIADVFGLSETATSDCILRPEDYDGHAGTIGRPSPGVSVRVVCETPDGFQDAGVGKPGELWIRTPHLMTGYLGDPDATAQTMTQDWLRTGDLAQIEADGYVTLVGRAKNLIVRGGAKISPLEVEHVFSAYPGCSGAIAVGIADDVLGERIHLVMSARPDHEIDAADVREWGRSHIEHHKLPDRVHIVDDFPLGGTGKTDRTATAQIVQNLLEAESE